MKTNTALITVVDDDESIRESLPDLIRAFGFSATSFSSAEEFLKSESLSLTRCLILDVSMPGMSGPDLQKELKLSRRKIPIIFITAHVEETDCRRLIEQGAIDCLFKPFSEDDLLKAVNTALRESR
jgi:FixJ family two-component response regulator